MSRFTPYLGMAAALVFWILAASFFGHPIVPPASAPRAASSTLSVLPPLVSTSTTSSPVSTQATTTPAEQKTQQKKSEPTVSPVATQPISHPTSAPPPSPSTNAALDVSAFALRAALVNILCSVPSGSGLHSISGSGVIINPKGIILTNAHIAQYFLLANRDISCIIRSGSPAADNYRAKLIFISPAWINANADVLTKAVPSGTGEYDFAFLAITGSATASALPASFSFIPPATAPPKAGTPVVIASYGAQFLNPSQIRFSLFPTLVFGSVKDVFTFAVHTIDVLDLGGSAAAQEGSSGGGVANAEGELAGVITTSTITGDTNSRSLSAITASYVRAEYASETGRALDLLFAEPTATAIADFAPQMPALESILTARLP